LFLGCGGGEGGAFDESSPHPRNKIGTARRMVFSIVTSPVPT
jgi:hypothetical protein